MIMRFVKGSDRMPTVQDAIDNDVVVKWIHNDGKECIAATNYQDVREDDEWLEGAAKGLPIELKESLYKHTIRDNYKKIDADWGDIFPNFCIWLDEAAVSVQLVNQLASSDPDSEAFKRTKAWLENYEKLSRGVFDLGDE